MPRALPVVVLVSITALMVHAAAPTRADTPKIADVFDAEVPITDPRLEALRNLRDAYHPWKPATTKAGWEAQSHRLREQALVSLGLWPMWPKQELEPVIHGRIDRGDYTVEKVFFASLPGHYVTGNLYRPKNKSGRRPGILCPHGHWRNGRFYDAGDGEAKKQMESDGEQNDTAAHFPLQARMVHLARMGNVVFHYDMIGYADSKSLDHRTGFEDVQAGLWSQNWMGLQTWNSIRALDFVESLPDVDPDRIGVTGASGGGTQTFMLCALDPRPAAAFPAVMVSTGMQGGCVCENAPHLRVGVNNIAFAAMFAPRPLAMSGADDWTIEIETKGLPELRQVYSLYGRRDYVAARTWAEFPHNYNRHSRAMMYSWFRTHLSMGSSAPIEERDFDGLTQQEMSVFDEAHPVPSDAKNVAELKAWMTDLFEAQLAAGLPAVDAGANAAAAYRTKNEPAVRVLLGGSIPDADDLTITHRSKAEIGSVSVSAGTIRRKESRELIPWVVLSPQEVNGTAVIWIDGNGKGHLFNDGRIFDAARRLLNDGYVVVSADVFLTGEFLDDARAAEVRSVDSRFQGYTLGYNRTVLAHRVQDILALVSAASSHQRVDRIRMAGSGSAGLWVLLARALTGDVVERTVVDLDGFSFRNVATVGDENFLPGALRHGDVGGLAAMAGGGHFQIFGTKQIPESTLAPLTRIARISGGTVKLSESSASPDDIASAVLSP